MKLFSVAVLATAVSGGTKNRRASNPPNDGQSCRSARGKHQVGNRIWPNWQYHTKSNPSYNKCIFSNLLDSGAVGKLKMQRALWFLNENQSDRLVQNLYQPLINDWKQLAGHESVTNWRKDPIDCDFEPVALGDREGYINQCELMCPGLDARVNDKESAKNSIKKFLNGYLTVLNDQFAVKFKNGGGCMYDETDKGLNPVTNVTHDGWVNRWNDPCRKEDRCGQLVRNTYGHIAQFEPLLDYEFPNLDRSFLGDMKTLTDLNPEDNRWFKDLYRTGIFGNSTLTVPSKQQMREDEYRSRFPEDKRRINK